MEHINIQQTQPSFPGNRKSDKNPNNTCHFITKEQVPGNRFRDVTYIKFECTVRNEKAEKHRTRLVIGGNCIKNAGDLETSTVEMLLVKIMLNSVVSTPGAKFISINIFNFYLNTLMLRYEYMKLKLSNLPDKIIQDYKLRNIATCNGSVSMLKRKKICMVYPGRSVSKQIT